MNPPFKDIFTVNLIKMRLPPSLSRKISTFRSKALTHGRPVSVQGNFSSLFSSFNDVFCRTWDLGFTAFGGPPVHFQIFHRRFVEGSGGKQKWVDEQTVSPIAPSFQGLRSESYEKIKRTFVDMEVVLWCIQSDYWLTIRTISTRNSLLYAKLSQDPRVPRCYSVLHCYMLVSSLLYLYS